MLREWKRIEYYNYSLHVKYIETSYKHVMCVYVEGEREREKWGGRESEGRRGGERVGGGGEGREEERREGKMN